MQGMPVASGPDPASEREHDRWLVGYQRSEIRALEARIGELERQLRRRTFWLVAAAVLAGLTGATVATRAFVGDPFAYLASVASRLPAGS